MTEAISYDAAMSSLLREDLLQQLDSHERVEGVGVPTALTWHVLNGPRVEPHRLLGVLQEEQAALTEDVVVWECGDERWLGWGVAAEITPNSVPAEADGLEPLDRFQTVQKLAALTQIAVAGDRTFPPRWFGGFAFESAGTLNESQSDARVAAVAEAWRPFGAGAFVLPQIAVRRSGAATTWFLALSPSRNAAQERRAAVEKLSWLWNQIDAAGVASVVQPSQRDLSVAVAPESAGERPMRAEREAAPGSAESEVNEAEEQSKHEFAQRIQEVVDLIAAGAAQKIVAADQSVVKLAESPRLEQVLALWAERAPESTRFLYCRKGVAFLGATPERLVGVSGLRVRSQALAGTSPKQGAGPAEASGRLGGRGRATSATGSRLLSNPKEQHEHGFVVRHIVDRLSALCSEVTVDDEPTVLELRDLLHLQTPISARLDAPLHVLELVQSLHPTPAVCGLPIDVATAWIQTREIAERGWYSGPVGWFEPSGDGDFFVALRSMLLSPEEAQSEPNTEACSPWTQARLFAGVGLVAGSVVEDEQREVATKLLTAGRTLDPWRTAGR